MQNPDKSKSLKSTFSTTHIHLSDYFGIIRKRKWVVISFSVILVTIVTLLSLRTPHIYEATAKILIERNPYGSIKIADSFDKDIKEQDFYLTQYNLLQSRSLAYKVVEQLKLDENTGQSGDNKVFASDKSFMVDYYLSNLKIEPVPGTHIVNISYLSTSPSLSAKAANTHAQAFIDWISEMRISSSQQGLNWLNEHLKEQKAKLEESQRILNDYKKSHGIVSFEDRQNIVSQKLLELNTNLTRVKSERLSKQAVYDQLMSFTIDKENIFSMPEVSHDNVIQNLRNQLLQARSKKLELSSNYGPRHPKMIEIDSQISHLENEITNEIHRLGRTIKAELDRSLAYEKSLQQTLDNQKYAALSQNDKAIKYEILEQDAQSNQKIYENLLKQAKELGLASAVYNSNVSIVDKAEIPLFPIKPRTFMNIFLSIIVSLFMGPFFAFFFEYMDRTIKTPEDVVRRLGIPAFGVIPFYKKNKKDNNSLLYWDDSFLEKAKKPVLLNKNDSTKYLPVVPSNKNNFSDLVNRFIPGYSISRRDLYGKTIYIGSAAQGEGKSTIVANSAMGLLASGVKVLIIDADLEHPSLHNLFGVSNQKGLTNVMDEIFYHDIYHGNLNDYSIDDILFIINLKKYTGRLTITNNTHSITADFEKGSLFHIQHQSELIADRLGDMLIRSGHITKEQLETALDWHKKTSKPLGFILINAGFITHNNLQGILRLQTEENLHKLFSWKHGDFVFDEVKFNMNEDEKIYFGDNYTNLIKNFSSTYGNLFIEDRLFANIYNIKENNICLLPVGTGNMRSYNPVFSKMLIKFFEVLKRHFDMILIDAPPVIDISNSLQLASLCDGSLFVVKAGKLPDKTIKEALSKLQESGANIIGVILNQADVPSQYYYYHKNN